jgi:hypothetical protein
VRKESLLESGIIGESESESRIRNEIHFIVGGERATFLVISWSSSGKSTVV